MPDKRHPKHAVLLRIARDELGVHTLNTRNSDSLDFHDVAVWSIRNALAAAYDAGKRAGSRPKRSK